MVHERGQKVALEAEVADLKAERRGWAAERAAWVAAASGKHDRPEPLLDYSVPLSPAQMSQLVADGRQHGWPDRLDKQLDERTAALRATAAELSAFKGLGRTPAELGQLLDDVEDRAGSVEMGSPKHPEHELLVRLYKALRERAHGMEAEIKNLATENRDLRTSLDRAGRRAQLALRQQTDGRRVDELEQQLAAERADRETDATSAANEIRSLQAAASERSTATAQQLTAERAGRAEDRRAAEKQLKTERGRREAAEVALTKANAGAAREAKATIADAAATIQTLRTEVADAAATIQKLRAENEKLRAEYRAQLPDPPSRPTSANPEPSTSDRRPDHPS